MKIQALYHFECEESAGDYCEENGYYAWSVYNLIRRSGQISSMDTFLDLFSEVYLRVNQFTNFMEISLQSATNDHCDVPISLFNHRIGTDSKFAFAGNIMFYVDDSSMTVNVCFLEIDESGPDSRQWEQGLESFLDHQISELLNSSEPVPVQVKKE